MPSTIQTLADAHRLLAAGEAQPAKLGMPSNS